MREPPRIRDYLDTAKLRLSELRRGQVVPSAAVGVGLIGGLSVPQLVIGALAELGVPLGPHTAALVAVVITAGAAYLTRSGRRQKKPRRGPRT